ncbi:MAG: hypothetical protein P4L83_20530, partial [Nevskia sp.]|nr:hypothetical protein [Nevskia sp.]
MESGRPSATARSTALSRAAHQLLDHPRVLEDPIALRIIGPDAAASIQAASERFTQGIARYLRAFLVARSRYAEDELRKAVDS